MMAETYGGIHVYPIKNVQQIHMYYEGTSEYDMKDWSWVFGTLLNSTGFAKDNLWWGRFAY